MTATPAQRLHKIVDDGLCIGCGLCAGFAGPDAIAFGRGADGNPRPFAKDALTDEQMDKIYRFCPSTRVEGLPQPLIDAAPHHDLVWGHYHTLYTAHATDAAIRHQGATAGVLTALACFLLQSGKVDFIAHVRASEDPPHFGVATISRTIQETVAASGSRYGPAAPLLNLPVLLERNRPFALVVKPCDINAMRNLAHMDARVNQYVRWWLTPVCGGFMPDEGCRQFLARHDIALEDVRELRYRGYGCPGPTRVTLRNGDVIDFDYLDVWGEDESQWSLHFRCKICPDGIGEGADIAAADTWPGGAPTREGQHSDPGLNSLIVRTAAGMELMTAAEQAGWISLESRIDVAYLNRTQPHQVKKKYAAPARIAGLQQAGSIAPELVNLRAEALAAAVDKTAFEQEKQGAARRALAARNTMQPDIEANP